MQHVCTQCSHLPLLRNQNPGLEREPGSWSPTLTPISERRGVHGQGRELPLRGRRQNCEGSTGAQSHSLRQTAGDWSCSVHWRSSRKMGEKAKNQKPPPCLGQELSSFVAASARIPHRRAADQES